VYVREWRRYMGTKSVDCAIALDIERESYLRLERAPYKFNIGELVVLAETIGVKPNQFFFPPPAQGENRVSLDEMLDDLADDRREMVVNAFRGMVGK
jgi:hypothetical protein